jgi:hypothetical protein
MESTLGKPRQGEIEAGERVTAGIVKSDRFFTKAFTPEGREFFIFAEYGDELIGELLHGSRSNHAINRTVSYKVTAYSAIQGGVKYEYPEGQIEEFFANKQLQRILRAAKNEGLVGKMIRIVYIGREKSGFGGHSAKVYRIFEIKGFITQRAEEVTAGRGRR